MRIATAIILCLIIYDSISIPVQYDDNNNNSQEILSRKVLKSNSKYKYQASNLSLSEKFRKISNNEEKQLETKQALNETVDKIEKKENSNKCNCKDVEENSRQMVESDRMKTVANVAIDVLLTLMQPLFGLPGVILGNLVRPLLTYMTTRLFAGGQTFIKNMMSEENQGTLRDEPYAAYPVYIPGYGSYILLSDIGPSELINTTAPMDTNESKDIPESKDIEEEEDQTNNGITNNDSGSSVHNIKDRRENNKKYRDVFKESEGVLDVNERNKIVSQNNESAETKEAGNDDADSIVDDVSLKNNKFNSLFLGQTHLIPIIKKPHVFESEKDLEEANWSGETGDSIRESIKQIVGSGAKIKSLKKRIMLNILEKLRGAIAEF